MPTLCPHGRLCQSWRWHGGHGCPSLGCLPQGEPGCSAPPLPPIPPRSFQEMNIQQLTNYRKSIMNLSDGGKLYRKELEIVLCNEPPM